MGYLSGGVVPGDQGAQGNGERIDQSVGDPTICIGIPDGEACPFFNVLVKQVHSLIGGGPRDLARLVRTGALAGAKRPHRGGNQVFTWSRNIRNDSWGLWPCLGSSYLRSTY